MVPLGQSMVESDYYNRGGQTPYFDEGLAAATIVCDLHPQCFLTLWVPPHNSASFWTGGVLLGLLHLTMVAIGHRPSATSPSSIVYRPSAIVLWVAASAIVVVVCESIQHSAVGPLDGKKCTLDGLTSMKEGPQNATLTNLLDKFLELTLRGCHVSHEVELETPSKLGSILN